MTVALPETDDLWSRLRSVEQRVRKLVEARRADGASAEDPFLGMYLTAEAVDRILDSAREVLAPQGFAPLAPGSRLGTLAERFGLTALDVELLLIALAPDLDARFERLYGFLHDDLTRRRPTIGLALELCGLPAAGPGRFRFAPLRAGGLLEIGEPERPMLTRSLRVPDRITAHLLGDDEPDERLHGLITVHSGVSRTGAERVAAAVATGPVHLLDADGAEIAVAALRDAVEVDVTALGDVPREVVRTLVTEARLRGAGIVLGPVEALDPRRPERARLLRDLHELAAGTPVITFGATAWDPLWSTETPLPIRIAAESQTARWLRAVDGIEHAEVADAVGSFRLGTHQIRRAAKVAERLARLDGRPVAGADLRTAARGQNGAGLDRLARRITPGVGWDDLVLPEATRRQLRELSLRARHRDLVLGEWRMRPGGGRGRGVLALFAGESGTGKTMSAEVVAAELGMELYVVDLSTVVDKYIGETEKNLERIFTEAAGVNGVLLFDEADAIFGKRSQVQDAHDRHANIESAYLLQRMESFDGIAVLTTNLRANLDDAFLRRLDVVADFPIPDERQRLALWDRCLGEVPRDAGLDLEFFARRFELAGGSIRACAVTAAYLAADAGCPVGMPQLVAAVLQEYRKLGRLLLESEFGPWLEGQ